MPIFSSFPFDRLLTVDFEVVSPTIRLPRRRRIIFVFLITLGEDVFVEACSSSSFGSNGFLTLQILIDARLAGEISDWLLFETVVMGSVLLRSPDFEPGLTGGSKCSFLRKFALVKSLMAALLPFWLSTAARSLSSFSNSISS